MSRTIPSDEDTGLETKRGRTMRTGIQARMTSEEETKAHLEGTKELMADEFLTLACEYLDRLEATDPALFATEDRTLKGSDNWKPAQRSAWLAARNLAT